MVFLAGLSGGAYWALQSSRVQTFLTQKLAGELSEKINADISVGRVDISLFRQVIFENVLLRDQTADTLFFAQKVTAELDSLKYKKRKIVLGRIAFEGNRVNLKKDTARQFNFSFLIDSLKSPEKKQNEWQLFCNTFTFSGSKLNYTDSMKNQVIEFKDLAFEVTDFSMIQDSLHFKLDQLTLNDGKNFTINELNSVFSFANNKIDIDDFDLKTGHSQINESKFTVELPDSTGESSANLQIDAQFLQSKISLFDLAQLAPSLKGMNQVIDFSGAIQGNLDDLKGRNLKIKTGQNTSALLDFYLNGLSNPETMYLFLDLKKSQTTFSDLSRIKLPAKEGRTSYLKFPEAFYESGLLTYKGNFTGFLSDFVAYGTLTSEMGYLTTDISVVPDEMGRTVYRGEVATGNFRLGELFQIESVGEITFDGRVDGFFDRENNSVAGAFEGDIFSVDVNGYNYKNIELDGLLNNRMFDGLIIMDDPNLQFNFLGKMNFNPEIPVFDFRVELQKALPGKLNLSKNFPDADVSFTMNANFSGDKIDNLAGTISVENGTYKNRNGQLNLEGMELQSITGDSINYLTFTSDFFDAKINGNYHFQNILDAFEKSFDRYIPAINYEKTAQTKINKFGFQIDVKKLDGLMEVFAPKYRFETPFLLYGRLDSEQSVFEMKGSIPGFSTPNLIARNISIGNSPRGELYASIVKLGEIYLKNGMKLKNFTFNSKISDNAIDNQISWGTDKGKSYSGIIKTLALLTETPGSKWPHVEVEGIPTEIFIGDSLWQISPFSATIDSSDIEIKNFSFYSGPQQINIDGKIACDTSEVLMVDFKNINLWNISDYLQREFPVGGQLDGTAGIQDFYGQRLFFSNLNISDFHFKDQRIGNISMVNEWDLVESVIKSELNVTKNNHQSLVASGFYNPENNQLNYNARVDDLALIVLETVIKKTFSDFQGTASGNVKIHGTPDKILLDGTVAGKNAGLTIDYTNVSYNFTDSVHFKGDTLHFDSLQIKDMNGNPGTFNGTLVHTNFQDMIYNLSVQSPKILAINTTTKDNDQFFGKVIANGSLKITGRGQQVDLTGSATTLSGTNVNINLENDSEPERYDFIRFVDPDKEEETTFTFTEEKEEGNFSMTLNINATTDARARLIYDARIGDVISARGVGNLILGMDNEGNITLSGSYTVEQGDYLFTLQNVINKRFTIEQGGTIDWSGDPYDAIIDISAIYKLKASLYNLLVNTYDNIYQNQRIPVECKILLSEDLSNPEIDFQIDFPTVEDRLIDELRQFFNTPEEMNKQILSLVVLGQFYTPEYLRGTYEAQTPNLIGTTASELFSNQLSNWLSQINNNMDIGFNYRPGNQITDDEIELALSTQMFNDRVTINGNIGNNNNPNSTNNSQLVGDFEVNVKLIPGGKVQFKAYNRSNNNLIYETAPYTQGIGFSFTEEYHNFNDLLKKMKALFNSKKEE